MKFIVTVTFLYLIAGTQCYQPQSNTFGVKDFNRSKTQDAPWVWRQIPVDNKQKLSKAQPRATTAAPISAKPHPCDPYVPQSRPDFRRGRRISEAKCLEYIWAMKIRQDNSTHDAECVKWKTRLWGRRLVIGGRDTVPGEFPHMGALGWRAVKGTWKFKCGSSLISSKFVVTAAHCSRASSADTTISDPRPQIVRLGDKNIMDVANNDIDPVDVKISRIIVHPQYAAPKKYFDIALMELVEKVTFTKYVQPACLWTQFDTHSLGSKATVIGWGYIDSARTRMTPELQVAELDFISQSQCDALLRSTRIRLFNGLQPHQICAGKLSGGVDTCQGDSGGPLQVKISLPITNQGSLHRLVGVTSFGIRCARANSPGIYTRVASFIDWIEDTVWGREKIANIFLA